eukprot:3598309-Rhodomonas_salina.1
MAQGYETLPEVKLWLSALICWGEIFEEDPHSFPFEKLKISVVQGLSCFTEEEPTEDQGYAKRPHLNQTLPPAVAFSVEELNYYCAHAYAAGAQFHNPDIVCWNCNGIGHPGSICPYQNTSFFQLGTISLCFSVTAN